MKPLVRLVKIGDRGNAMVEFALSFGLMFPIFAGVFQFGYSFYIYNQLETAVRSAARYAASRTYDSPNSTPSSAYTNAVRNLVVYGNPAGGTMPTVPGLTAEKVQVTVNFASGVPDNVRVNINGYTIQNFFGPMRLTGKPATTFPFIGRWDP